MLRGDYEADAVVVGLGGSGLACVDQLLHEGLSVLGLDAGRIGGAAAGRNGGFLRAGTSLFYHDAAAKYGIDRAARMYSATVIERERLLSRYPGVARRVGYLRLAHDAEEERDCRAHLAMLRQGPFASEWYDGPLGTGVLIPDDAVIDPLARCRLEAAHCVAKGATLFEHSKVLTLSEGSVVTQEGAVRCRRTIVAVDGALSEVLPELGDRVWPMRLQMLASGPHPRKQLPHAIGTRWGWDYAQQLPDGMIALGGCRDIGGDAERTIDTRVTGVVQGALERRFREITGLEPAVTHRWAATAGYTANGLPLLEEVRPTVWAIGGYCGTGNLLGAACGRAVVRMALGLARDHLLS